MSPMGSLRSLAPLLRGEVKFTGVAPPGHDYLVWVRIGEFFRPLLS